MGEKWEDNPIFWVVRGGGDPTSLLPLGEALLCGVGKGIAQKNSREGQDQGMIYLWDG